MEVLKITVQEYFRTWEEICLEKLREIGRDNRNGVTTVIKRIRRTMPDKLVIYYNQRPRLYEAQ